MIDLIFEAGAEMVSVRIINKHVFFMQIIRGVPVLNDLSEIKMPIEGLLKEFPDLEGKPDSEIRKEGSRRFNVHISKMETEMEIKNYVIEELEKIGCVLTSIVKPGHRPIIIRRKE